MSVVLDKKVNNHGESFTPWNYQGKFSKTQETPIHVRTEIQIAQQVENQACHCLRKEDVVYTTISGSDLAELFLGNFNLEHMLFHFIPFVVRPNGAYSFMKSCQHVGTMEDVVLLQACLKLGDAIHVQENMKQDPITGNQRE